MSRRLLLLVLALLAALALSAVPAAAAPPPPPNDNVADAAPLTSDGAPLLGDNLGSTSEPTESAAPAHGDHRWDDCAAFAERPDCGGSVWYVVTPTTTESYTVQTCELGTELDTVLTAYTGSGLPALGEVAHNDDFCAGGYSNNGSLITFPATAGTPYRIQVAGYGGQEGTFWLRAFPSASPPPAAPLDTRITRYQSVTPTASEGNGTHSGGRRTATFAFVSTKPAATFECSLDGAAFAACTSPAEYDGITVDGVQHSFRVRASAGPDTDTTPSEQLFTLDASIPDTSVVTPATDGTTGGNPFAYALSSTERSPNFPSVCTLDGSDPFSCGGPPPGSLTGLCNGPHALSAASYDESVNIDPTPAVRAFTITGSTPCAAPQLGTATMGLIAPTQAQVTAPLTTGGAPVTATLSYGTTAAYGEQVRARLAANSVAANLGPQGLAPGTTYHYDLSIASTVGPPASSGDQTFTTPALGAGEALPAVVVGTPEHPGRHAARIPISTDVGAPASGMSVTVYIDDHGPITLASPFAALDDNVPLASAGQTAAPLDALDLKPGTIYHFRVLVSGLHSVLTDERTFTTAAIPVPPAATPVSAPAPASPAGTPKAKHFKLSKSRVKISAFKRSATSIKVTVTGLPKGTKVVLGVKGSKTLGKGRATASKSGAVTIRVKLGAKARKALKSKRLKRLTFTLKATPPGDTSSSVTVKLKPRS